MRNVFKTGVALTLILMLGMMTGCGTTETISVGDIGMDGNVIFKSKAVNDLKNGTAPERYTGGSYEVSDKLDVSMTSFELQIYEDIYKFPMSFDEFMSYGWRLDVTQSFEVKGERTSRVWFKNGNLRLCFYIYNPDVVSRTYDKCYVNGLTTYLEGTKTDHNIFLPGGYRLGEAGKDTFFAGCSEVTQRWDNALGETFAECRQSEKSPNKAMLKFNSENLLEAFEIQCYTLPEGFSRTNVDDSGYAKEYKAPDKLGSDPRDGVFQFGDELYRVPVPLDAFLANDWKIAETESESNFKVSSSDETVPVEKQFDVQLTKRRRQLSLRFANPYESECTAKNCVLNSLPFELNTDIVLSGNIKKGMDKNALVQVLKNNSIDYKEEDKFIKFSGTEELGTKDLSFSISITDDKIDRISVSR